MSKKRPGVEAAVRLAATSDVAIWERVESQLGEVLASIKDLETFTEYCETLGQKLMDKKKSITKKELLEIIKWKFAVGKPRHVLMKLLNANTETSVKENSMAAISQAGEIPSQEGTSKSKTSKSQEVTVKSALEHLTKLKGVGPATASAVLTLVRPDTFCYMYDEVIDCFLPKRTYTMPVYLTANAACLEIANKKLEGWTPSRVARTLWVAARVCASGGQDHTLENDSTGGKRTTEKASISTSKETKRRRRR
jgi:hypothetical protein